MVYAMLYINAKREWRKQVVNSPTGHSNFFFVMMNGYEQKFHTLSKRYKYCAQRKTYIRSSNNNKNSKQK